MRLFHTLFGAVMLFAASCPAQTTKQFVDERFTLNTGLSIFGNGSLASVDFESAIKVKNDMHLCFKVGIGLNITEHACPPFCRHTQQYDMASLPIHMLTLIYVARKNKGQAFLEMGLGGTIAFSEEQANYLVYPIVGYRVYPFRYLPLYYRIYTHLPYVRRKADHFCGYYTPFGLSLGYSL